MKNKRAKTAFRFAFLVASALLAAPAAAQTWMGAGADNNWSTGANWSGGVPPASSPTTHLDFLVSAPPQSPVVDAPWTVNSMWFSGAYTVTGQAITFAGTTPNILTALVASIANSIVLTGPTGFGGSGGFLTVSGPITGTGPLLISGVGRTTLSGASSFTGGISVSSAAGLTVNGSVPGPVTLSNAGTLGGQGTIVGDVIATGSGGGLVLVNRLNTGNLTLATGSSVGVTINGPSQGTQYGTVNVTGTVSLGDATLLLSGPYAPVPGDVFTIVSNDGSDPVVGTFTGLAEGAIVTFNSVPLRISYVGGTGNNVTLTALAAAPLSAPITVPTLSEWGLVLLAALIGIAAMVHVRSNR